MIFPKDLPTSRRIFVVSLENLPDLGGLQRQLLVCSHCPGLSIKNIHFFHHNIMNCLIENARNIIRCFQDSPKLYYAVSINTDEFPDTNGCRFYDIGDEGLFYFEVSCLAFGKNIGSWGCFHIIYCLLHLWNKLIKWGRTWFKFLSLTAKKSQKHTFFKTL